ncbi:MAG: acetyl-CoA carboxylase biotin carboxyl carrier protein [Candidatus Eremiobacteraeota bacterium]|nr:acetyl-CoA carboxylase biotin carboxyl carrier protein [Candidatus Eremiobacteraeota bacterium]
MERDPETETLEELLELMHEHDLDRLKVKRGDAVYEIVRREASAPTVAVTPAAVTAPAAAETETAAAPSSHAKRILAPLTGVFYRSASPDAEAFVDVGDRIEAGDVVCVLEAMKLFNEIQSDYSGTVSRIVPENGELVSQGEDLFWIEP